MDIERDLVIFGFDWVGDRAIAIAKHDGVPIVAKIALSIGLTLKSVASTMKRDPTIDLDLILCRIRGPSKLPSLWPDEDDTDHDTPSSKKRK